MNACEIAYVEHFDFIKAKAIHYSRMTGRNVSDLISVGNVLFLKAWESWDISKQSNFKSWLNWWLRGMLDEVSRLDLPPTSQGEPVDLEAFYSTEEEYELPEYRDVDFREAIESLSENISVEARLVLAIVLNGPSDVLDVAEDATPRAIRGALKAYLEELGFGWRAWRRVRDEINTVLDMKKEMDNGLRNY